MNLHNNNNEIEKKETNGRDEMNIVEAPITTLQYQSPKETKSLSFIDERTDKDGRRIKIEWIVSFSGEYGQPGFFANKLLLALMLITKEQNNFTNREVHCSINHILKVMKLPNTKQYRNTVMKNMEQLGGVWVAGKQSFWDNKEKCYKVEMGFGIIDNFSFPKLKDKKGKNFTELEGEFFWNQIYFKETFQKNNIKYLDINFCFTLDYPISLSLYRLLDKRKYFQSVIEFPLIILALEKLGMSRTYDTAQIKRCLDRANQELKDKGFLKGSRYYQDKYGDWWIVYYLSEQKKLEQTTTPETPHKSTEETKPEELNPLSQELIKRRVSEPVAIKLVEQYPPEVIQLQIEHYDYLISIGKKIESAGWFVRAIPENWMPPEDFKSSAQLKQEEIARTKREKAREKAEEEQQKLEAEKASEQARLDLQRRKAFYNNPNQAEYDALWEQAKSKLEAEIPHQPFLTWINPNFIAKIDGNTIYIDAPNTFIMNWLTKNYAMNLKNTFTDIINEEAHIRFLVSNVNNPQTPQMPDPNSKSTPQNAEKKVKNTAKRGK